MKILGRFSRRNRDFTSVKRYQQMLAALNPQGSTHGRNNPASTPGPGPQEVAHARNENHQSR